jgi:hypothetical protein
MNNEKIIKELIEIIKKIEADYFESGETENKEIRGEVLTKIISELERVVRDNED